MQLIIPHKKNLFLFIPALLLFLWSFVGERFYFNFATLNNRNQFIYYFISKFVLAALLLFLTVYTNKFITYYKMHAPQVKIFIKAFLIESIVMAVIFIIIFPGIWNVDTLFMVHALKSFELTDLTQSLMSNLFATISLSIIPKPFGVILFQLLFIITITSYEISLIWSRLKENRKWIAWLLIIPEFMPLIIITNNFGLRMALFSHCFSLLLILIWDTVLHTPERASLTKRIILLSLLCGIVASWRFEGKFVCIMLFIFVLFFIKASTLKDKVTSLILPIVICTFITSTTDRLLGYSLTDQDICRAMWTSLSLMLQDDLNGKNLDSWLADVNLSIDIEVAKANPNPTSPTAMFAENAYKTPDAETLKKSFIGFAKIVLHNPLSYINSKCAQINASESFDFIGYTQITDKELHFDWSPYPPYPGETSQFEMPFQNIRTNLLNKLYSITNITTLDNILEGISTSLAILAVIFIYLVIHFKKNKMLFLISVICVLYTLLLLAGMAMSWSIYFSTVVVMAFTLLTLLLSTQNAAATNRKPSKSPESVSNAS